MQVTLVGIDNTYGIVGQRWILTSLGIVLWFPFHENFLLNLILLASEL